MPSRNSRNPHQPQPSQESKPRPWARFLAVGTFMFFLLKGLGWIALFVAGYFGLAELSYFWLPPAALSTAPQLS